MEVVDVLAVLVVGVVLVVGGEVLVIDDVVVTVDVLVDVEVTATTIQSTRPIDPGKQARLHYSSWALSSWARVS